MQIEFPVRGKLNPSKGNHSSWPCPIFPVTSHGRVFLFLEGTPLVRSISASGVGVHVRTNACGDVKVCCCFLIKRPTTRQENQQDDAERTGLLTTTNENPKYLVFVLGKSGVKGVLRWLRVKEFEVNSARWASVENKQTTQALSLGARWPLEPAHSYLYM